MVESSQYRSDLDARSAVTLGGDGLHVKAITDLTAEPVLAILLTQAGLFPPNQLAVREAWHAFQLFLRIPTVGRDEGASFQSEIVNEGTPMAAIRFIRQMGAPDGDNYSEAVAIQFLFDSFPSDFGEKEVWSQDFVDLKAFAEHVETLAEFQFAIDALPQHALLYMAEPR